MRRSPTSMSPTLQFCTFYLDKVLFGVELRGVQEVIQQVELTDVPLAPAVVGGLINLRGQIVTAIDLRRRLELPERPDDIRPVNVVVRTGDGAVSLLVDEIGDVIEVDESTFELPPETLLDLHMGSVSIAINKDGVLGFMWYSKDSDHVYFGASFDGGQSISKVVQLTPNLPSIPARERPLADDRRLDIYSPAWNNNSNRLEPLTILAFSPNFSGIPGGNGLVADRSGTFHAVWDEVTNGAASLWTRTITLSESGENAAVPTLEGLTDVSNKVSFNVSDVRLDQLDDLAAFDLVVTNRSDTTLLSPVLVILASPSGQPEMSAYNADNGKLGDGALWELQLPSGRLAPGHSAEPRTLILRMKIPVKDNLTTYQPAEIPLRIYAKLP